MIEILTKKNNLCLRGLRFIARFCIRRIQYRGADKSLARPTSRYILFDGENISFDASLVIGRLRWSGG